jgi:hypothetical protein
MSSRSSRCDAPPPLPPRCGDFGDALMGTGYALGLTCSAAAELLGVGAPHRSDHFADVPEGDAGSVATLAALGAGSATARGMPLVPVATGPATWGAARDATDSGAPGNPSAKNEAEEGDGGGTIWSPLPSSRMGAAPVRCCRCCCCWEYGE